MDPIAETEVTSPSKRLVRFWPIWVWALTAPVSWWRAEAVLLSLVLLAEPAGGMGSLEVEESLSLGLLFSAFFMYHFLEISEILNTEGSNQRQADIFCSEEKLQKEQRENTNKE